MTNEELKKKIDFIVTDCFYGEKLVADALIEAGIGDVNAAVKDVAERIKNALFCEFADDMTFKMASRIEKAIKEACDAGETESD